MKKGTYLIIICWNTKYFIPFKSNEMNKQRISRTINYNSIITHFDHVIYIE